MIVIKGRQLPFVVGHVLGGAIIPPLGDAVVFLDAPDPVVSVPSRQDDRHVGVGLMEVF